MPARIALPLALLLLALAAPAPTSASHVKGKCRGGKTISQNSVARLYESDSTLFGCVWADDEPVELDTRLDDDTTVSEDYLGPRLAGRFAAWTHYSEDVSCKADCPPDYSGVDFTVNRVDLKTERSATVGGAPAGSTLRVNKRGAVTWLERLGGGRRAVNAWDADGHRVLDSGPIRTGSYSLRGSVLRWTNGDQAHAVTLR
ncbi:MAG TPA: hypothetical protein VF715_01415 [Thermoleophilaceae bacterium]